MRNVPANASSAKEQHFDWNIRAASVCCHLVREPQRGQGLVRPPRRSNMRRLQWRSSGNLSSRSKAAVAFSGARNAAGSGMIPCHSSARSDSEVNRRFTSSPSSKRSSVCLGRRVCEPKSVHATCCCPLRSASAFPGAFPEVSHDSTKVLTLRRRRSSRTCPRLRMGGRLTLWQTCGATAR